MFRVKVYNTGVPTKSGSGLFAAAVARHFPLLPLEDEGRLKDPVFRENFIERVFSYRRWKDFLVNDPSLGRLVAFITTHKLLMMAHSPEIYRTMGALVVHGRELPIQEGVVYERAGQARHDKEKHQCTATCHGVLYATAQLCGHAGPEVTLLHYIHLCDLLLGVERSDSKTNQCLMLQRSNRFQVYHSIFCTMTSPGASETYLTGCYHIQVKSAQICPKGRHNSISGFRFAMYMITIMAGLDDGLRT